MRALGVALLAALAACGGRTAAAPPAAPSALDLRSFGGLVFLGLELPPSGTTLGGHFHGAQFGTRQFSYQMSEAVRSRWARGAQQRGEARLRGAGFQVRAFGQATSDAERVSGVQYGLSGRAVELEIRSSGAAEPYIVDVQIEVAWELLDVGSGHVVFGRSHRAGARVTGTVDSAVGMALDRTLERLLADSTFLGALSLPRASPDAGAVGLFTRPPPRDDEILILTAADQNPAPEATIVARVAGGVVGLRGPGDAFYGAAILLTRDGYALTTARAARSVRSRATARARFENGVERPVRTMRISRGLGVALVQIACPGDCRTVAWDAPAELPIFTAAVAVGASGGVDGGITIAQATIGGRWGVAKGLTVEGPVFGGEALADAASGTVIAIVTGSGMRQAALLLSEALAALRVRPPVATAP